MAGKWTSCSIKKLKDAERRNAHPARRTSNQFAQNQAKNTSRRITPCLLHPSLSKLYLFIYFGKGKLYLATDEHKRLTCHISRSYDPIRSWLGELT